MQKNNDYIILFSALGGAYILVYFIPQTVNQLLFFIFIYLFYKSEKDYLWLAFIFIIISSPGGLFGGGEKSDELRMPIYTVIPSISVTFFHIFTITAFIKAVKKNIRFSPLPFIKNNITILFVYFILLILIGIGIGSNYEVVRQLFFIIIELSLFYSVYYLLRTEEDYVNFFKMLIPFGFIALGLQLYSVSTGEPLVKYIKPYATEYSGAYNIDAGELRPIELTYIITILFFFSYYFLLHTVKYFNKGMMIILNIITFFSMVLSASRSWVIMFVMFYLLSLIFVLVKVEKVFLRYAVIGGIAIIFLFTSDLFLNQLDSAMNRLSTVEEVAKGDITGGGTVKRFDIRTPRLLKVFYEESTIIFGAGFSDTYFRKSDGHIGFINLLFNTGFAGVILFAIFLGSIIINSFKINKRLKHNNPYKDVLKIFPVIIISFVFLNTGVQVFGYDAGAGMKFMLIYVIYFLNNQINCAMKWEEENG